MLAGPDLPDTRPVRRELARRVVALDPVIDEALGESASLRYHSPSMQTAVDGLLAALAGWRTVASHLEALRPKQARLEAGSVLGAVSPALRSASPLGEPTQWLADPLSLRKACEASMRRLTALPAATPSLQLLAYQTEVLLAGIARTLDGVALLVSPARSFPRQGGRLRLRVPDWLPSLVNAGRAFIAISAVAVFWILTEWPNGAQAMAFAAIGVILFAPRADQAYSTALGFTIGTSIGAIFAAVVAFAVLPNVETFGTFSIALGLVLVPAGAGMAQSWQTAAFTGLAALFVPLLSPANEMSYNTVQFYNTALAIVGGVSVAALAFRLIPPLSPAFRTQRLMASTLRDLRHLAARPIPLAPADWQSRIYGRFSVLPDEAPPLQRSELSAALSVGLEIIELRGRALRPDQAQELDAALEAVARGSGTLAIARLAGLDLALASCPSVDALRARSSILAVSEALSRHADYFNAGAHCEIH